MSTIYGIFDHTSYFVITLQENNRDPPLHDNADHAVEHDDDIGLLNSSLGSVEQERELLDCSQNTDAELTKPLNGWPPEDPVFLAADPPMSCCKRGCPGDCGLSPRRTRYISVSELFRNVLN